MTSFKAGTPNTNGSEFAHCPYFLRGGGGAYKVPAFSLKQQVATPFLINLLGKYINVVSWIIFNYSFCLKANTAHHHFQTIVSITLETKYGTTRAVISILK